MAGHYLGGRSFGPFITGATIFASLFSGYTVVGVPNESFRLGFYGKATYIVLGKLFFYFPFLLSLETTYHNIVSTRFQMDAFVRIRYVSYIYSSLK